MISLINEPLAPLLERLFEEAEETNQNWSATDLSTEEQSRLMHSKTDYLVSTGG